MQNQQKIQPEPTTGDVLDDLRRSRERDEAAAFLRALDPSTTENGYAPGYNREG